jgi:uncharacterized protein (TIGR01244 family)
MLTFRVAAVNLALALSWALVAPPTAAAQNPTGVPASMPGIDTYRPVTTTIACGSNATREAMEPLHKAGFSTVISFSEDGEAGYDRPALARAAAAAGLRYVSIPFNRERPDPKAAQRFLAVIADPDTGPAYLGCHSGQRSAVMWAIKRVKQDGWSLTRAMAEAESVGLSRPELKQFVSDYVAGRLR